MKNEIKNYGFDASKVELDSTQYLAGSTSKLGDSILQADGDWTPYIPAYEPQFTAGYDTYGCTCFGTQNAIEMLMKKIHGGEFNFSERFNYILANIRPPGADPHKVAEVIRTKGLINQELLPLAPSYEEFIQPDPMEQKYLDIGNEFLKDKEIRHEWIFTNNPKKADRIALLNHYLKRGTVCVSVTAWYQDDKGLYADNGQPNTHWCTLIRIDEENGEYYPVIIDSYDMILYGKSTAYVKKLHPDHQIYMAKRYNIVPKLTEEKRKSFLAILADILKKLLNIQTEVDKLKEKEEAEVKVPVTAPIVVTTPFPEPVAPKYLWDTQRNTAHSVRVICDDEGLNFANKDIITAVVAGESEFKNTAINRNRNSAGVVTSTDWGVCQINDYWHVGKGKEFSSVDEILTKPEKAVRFMIRMSKAGKLNLWIAYKNGSYKKYLNGGYKKLLA